MTRTRRLVTVSALVAVLGVTGCGQQTPSSVSASADDARAAAAGSPSTSGSGSDDAGTPEEGAPAVVRLAPGDPKPRLDCGRGARSTMVLDFAQGAKGAPTPEEAVGSRSVEDGEQLVVSRSGATAWVVGADGTARSEVDLLRQGGGWLVHQRTSCG